VQEELTKVLDNCFGIDERSVGFLPTYETVEQEKAQQAHHYAGIDESGYFSSISSLYEVPSDDENYNDYNENFNEFGSVCISSALFLFFTSFILYSNQLPNCDFSNSGQQIVLCTLNVEHQVACQIKKETIQLRTQPLWLP